MRFTDYQMLELDFYTTLEWTEEEKKYYGQNKWGSEFEDNVKRNIKNYNKYSFQTLESLIYEADAWQDVYQSNLEYAKFNLDDIWIKNWSNAVKSQKALIKNLQNFVNKKYNKKILWGQEKD